MDRYGLMPISVSTFNYQTECIDYLLTQDNQRLSDFLHSQYNTNESHETKEQLFEDGTRRLDDLNP